MEAQRGLMDGFIARGLQNPVKSQVTSQGFREHLVKGIIEDDHAYSLGEKPGMKKVFAYLLPRGISAPSHQTVRRDLDVLWEKLNIRLTRELKVRNCILLTT
jgi:NAD(P)H-flavin reductase